MLINCAFLFEETRMQHIVRLGQVFTPEPVVRRMLALRRNSGPALEPCCGDGAFLPGLGADATAFEIDPLICPPGAHCRDFFTLPDEPRFATIIGNPPYVRYRDVPAPTRARLQSSRLDKRSNLFLYFIEKCIKLLRPGGELIFITPRDFVKKTSARPLNQFLFRSGTITDFHDLGDERVFEFFTPNCAIWRFEKANYSRRTNGNAAFACRNGQLLFLKNEYPVPLAEVFDVKVGAASGLDRVYINEKEGNRDFVYARTRATGRARRMVYPEDGPTPYLLRHKEALLARRVRPFHEGNWWEWGRKQGASLRPRVYVNTRTRRADPFFLHPAIFFDGAILGLFPRNQRADLRRLCQMLNEVDWRELGFLCGGRYLFSQRALGNAWLPEAFREEGT